MNPLLSVFDFLIQTLFTLYIYVVMIRVILGLAHADFYNPFSQFILTITNPVLRPLRKFIPSVGRIDTAAIVLIFILKFLELFIRNYLINGSVVIAPLIVPTIFALINMVLNLFIFAIIVLVIISWIAPHMQSMQNPLVSILRSVTDPLMRPARKYIPRVGIFDLSPLVVLIVLLSIQRFLHAM